MKEKFFLLVLLTITFFWSLICDAKEKKEYQEKVISLATLNAEFLNFNRLHLKYTFDNNGEHIKFPFWLKPGLTNRDSLLAVALSSGDPSARKFFENFDQTPEYRKAVIDWGNESYRTRMLKRSSREVAHLIKQLNADLIVLTEVGSESDLVILNAELKNLGLKYMSHFVCKCSDKQTFQTVALMSKYPIVDASPLISGREGYFAELDDVESERSTGLSKGLKALVNINGEYFFIYGVHFKSERGASESDGQRIAQASIVRRDYLPLISSCIKSGKGKVKLIRKPLTGACPSGTKTPHVVVAGDLNEKRGQPALVRVRGLDDFGVDLIQTGAYQYFGEEAKDTRWTYEYEGIRNQIDHILISPSVLSIGDKGKTKISSMTIDHNNQRATDHNPLKVLLKYKKLK